MEYRTHVNRIDKELKKGGRSYVGAFWSKRQKNYLPDFLDTFNIKLLFCDGEIYFKKGHIFYCIKQDRTLAPRDGLRGRYIEKANPKMFATLENERKKYNF